MRFAFFPLHLSKVLRLSGKSDARSYEVLRLPRKMYLCRSSSTVPRLPSVLEMLQNLQVLLTFDKVHNQSLAPATQNDASTSKSGASMWWFVQFNFEVCFAPQRRALFRHRNVQKCSEPISNVLRATTACNFHLSSGQLAPHPPP